MELCEARRDTPSWRYLPNDGVPDDGLQRALDTARFAPSCNGYTHEYDVERYFRAAPLTVVGQRTSATRKIVITKSVRAQYAADG